MEEKNSDTREVNESEDFERECSCSGSAMCNCPMMQGYMPMYSNPMYSNPMYSNPMMGMNPMMGENPMTAVNPAMQGTAPMQENAMMQQTLPQAGMQKGAEEAEGEQPTFSMFNDLYRPAHGGMHGGGMHHGGFHHGGFGGFYPYYNFYSYPYYYPYYYSYPYYPYYPYYPWMY